MTFDKWLDNNKEEVVPLVMDCLWGFWREAQAEALKDQGRLIRAVFAAGFRCGQHHPLSQTVLGKPSTILIDDMYHDYKPKDIHSPEEWEKVP